ncbi:MAG: chorismate synthase [Proteobacteria bacterium]|jgi:chorismate synthase|nr:chorismate synthase [Pseudomonadota bacterium]
MSANQFGERFRWMTFGESHGPAIGVVIDGCPAGVTIDLNFVQAELNKRRPGQVGKVVSPRSETDQVEVLSGILEGKTLGTPIAMMIRNQDARSADYESVKAKPRAGHADDMWNLKFGHSDHRGGGRASGRETATRVMAGAVAQQVIQKLYPDLQFRTFASAIGRFELTDTEKENFIQSRQSYDEYSTRFPSGRNAEVESYLKDLQAKHDSVGGAVQISMKNVPLGLGQPVFHKLKSDLAAAFMSIGATAGVDLGGGDLSMTGQQFHSQSHSKNYGGVRGGISTGETITLTIFFKPTSSILDVARQGRHDPCIVIRAIPVVQAMAACVILDHLLWMRTDRI